jgi:uncharacterized protein (TIGR02284 family)
LRQIAHQLNGEGPDNGFDSKGLLHYFWMNFKTTLAVGYTEAIINACISSEEAAIKEYKLVLEDQLVSESDKSIIGQQINSIEQALAGIKTCITN